MALSGDNSWSQSQQDPCHQRWRGGLQLQCSPSTAREGEQAPSSPLTATRPTYLQRIRLASAHHLTNFYGHARFWHRLRASRICTDSIMCARGVNSSVPQPRQVYEWTGQPGGGSRKLAKTAGLWDTVTEPCRRLLCPQTGLHKAADHHFIESGDSGFSVNSSDF